MGRYEQKANGRGSLKDIQNLINNHEQLLNKKIKEELELSKEPTITWVSPIHKEGNYDNYAEYRDQDFLRQLGIDKIRIPLKKFWPSGGPQWDGLGKTDQNDFLLVEAKANIPEIVTPPTSAKDANSLRLIRKSLDEVKMYLNSRSKADWSSYFYQYTNRLAHLYFLRKLNNLKAYLVFIYFIGDKSVDGPKTKEEWLSALKVMKGYLGIEKRHVLTRYSTDIFINMNDLKL